MHEIILAVDRIEEGIAVCERTGGSHVHILASFLPSDAREGCRIRFADGRWQTMTEETEKLRAALFALQESLFDE